MDFEKLRQDAQNQLDQTLAEVDRLTSVAKELEKKNAEAQTEHDKLVESLTSDIDSLRAEKDFEEDEVEKVKVTLKERQDELSNLKIDLDCSKADIQALIDIIIEKKQELSSTEQTGIKDIQKLDEKITSKKKEMEAQAYNFLTSKQFYDKELSTLTKSIEKAQKELDVVTGAVDETNKTLANTKKEVKDIQHDAENADHQVILAREELVKVENQIKTTTQESEIATTTLNSLKEEIEVVQKELKPLLAKRIDSINYMKELEYKEANLRKKYEDVGLEYN